VQAVHVLRDQREVGAEALLEGRQRAMAGVGLNRGEVGATQVVEAPDQQGIAPERSRGSDLLDRVAFPQAAVAAKGCEAAFRGDAGAGQYRRLAGRAQQLGGPDEGIVQRFKIGGMVHGVLHSRTRRP
jgi:hypothetical protein